MKKRKIILYNPKLKEYARQLRNNSTKSEILLWQKLKRKQLYGYDFHRQKPIDNYILDFFSYELMLGIEIDGYSHQLVDIHNIDVIKEKIMNKLGIKILRFTDQQVFKDMFNILLAIEDYIQNYEKKKV
ncbi:endonuclease domain-containing protein [uncultured Aquimarina sp.]|uniref:endonuclease domain-containing protein n=1 Tax=uncultured Aquimarina sp. TaxID=575652 RepID=UPI00262C19DF|nr:endonuclease domain-containing protein [uncultured Aquimarina sp.]